jgi:hypothetical protein
MRFESRELLPYAQTVGEHDLREQAVYFKVFYIDDDMLIPSLVPVVFVGRNLQDEDTNSLYFQDYQSYANGVRWDESGVKGEAVFDCVDAEHTDVLVFERALDLLLACSIRRHQRASLDAQ